MCDLGINAENFNPQILYLGKCPIKPEFGANKYHKHECLEIKYILSGSCTYTVDNVHYQVHEGDVIVINEGLMHNRYCAHGEESFELFIGIDNLYIKNYQKNCILSDKFSPVMSLVKYGQEFLRSCSELIIENDRKEPGSDLVIKSHVMKMLAILLKELYILETKDTSTSVEFESNEKSYVVETMINFMNENYMKNISLDKLSKNMYLSPIYLSKIFKEETGDSPINYLIKIRLTKARELLRQKVYPVKEISKAVGYDDAYHFSKLYKKFFGIAPSKDFPVF